MSEKLEDKIKNRYTEKYLENLRGKDLKFEIYFRGVFYDITDKVIKEDSGDYTRSTCQDDENYKPDTFNIKVMFKISEVMSSFEKKKELMLRAGNASGNYEIKSVEDDTVTAKKIENRQIAIDFIKKYRQEYIMGRNLEHCIESFILDLDESEMRRMRYGISRDGIFQTKNKEIQGIFDEMQKTTGIETNPENKKGVRASRFISYPRGDGVINPILVTKESRATGWEKGAIFDDEKYERAHITNNSNLFCLEERGAKLRVYYREKRNIEIEHIIKRGFKTGLKYPVNIDHEDVILISYGEIYVRGYWYWGAPFGILKKNLRIGKHLYCFNIREEKYEVLDEATYNRQGFCVGIKEIFVIRNTNTGRLETSMYDYDYTDVVYRLREILPREIFVGKIDLGIDREIKKNDTMILDFRCEDMLSEKSVNNSNRIYPKSFNDPLTWDTIMDKEQRPLAWTRQEDSEGRKTNNILKFMVMQNIQMEKLMMNVAGMLEVFFLGSAAGFSIEEILEDTGDGLGMRKRSSGFNIKDTLMKIEGIQGEIQTLVPLNKCTLIQGAKKGNEGKYKSYWEYDVTKSIFRNLLDNRPVKFIGYCNYMKYGSVFEEKELRLPFYLPNRLVTEKEENLSQVFQFEATELSYEIYNGLLKFAIDDKNKDIVTINAEKDFIVDDVVITKEKKNEIESGYYTKLNTEVDRMRYKVFRLSGHNIWLRQSGLNPELDLYASLKKFNDTEIYKTSNTDITPEGIGEARDQSWDARRRVRKKALYYNLISRFLWEVYIKKREITFTTNKRMTLGLVYNLKINSAMQYLVYIREMSYNIFQEETFYKIRGYVMKKEDVDMFSYPDDFFDWGEDYKKVR